MRVAGTGMPLKMRLADLLGDPPTFQHVEPAPFHLGGSLNFGVNRKRL